MNLFSKLFLAAFTASLSFSSVVIASCNNNSNSNNSNNSVSDSQLSPSIDNVEINQQFVNSVHQFDKLFPFNEGLAAVQKDGKYGFINTEGRLVIPCQFQYIGDGFSEGLACVTLPDDSDLVCFVDKNGKVTKTRYRLSSSSYAPCMNAGAELPIAFKNGLCEIYVGDDSEYICINKAMQRVADNDGSNGEGIERNYDVAEFTGIINSNPKYQEETYPCNIRDEWGELIDFSKFVHVYPSDNGVVLLNIFIPDVDELIGGARYPDGLNLYGFIDKAGNSTFTDSDWRKLENYKNAQLAKARKR